ncbi:hypothetical protein [Aldersonia kunmingensis]|uniref:hypothetical protein n=1 Tax=Aldersonia kunmingensis TaxID=408066 RepID=UPI00083518FD|nr:hypothetical protein [Aldersonia kunmingensis]
MDASAGSKAPVGSWAKAPAFADDPARVEAVRAQTVADKANFMDEMTPVECRTCHIGVLVRKNSFQHTSIQWISEPSDSCPHYADASSTASRTARPTCPRLKASIEHAVLEGYLHIPDETAE